MPLIEEAGSGDEEQTSAARPTLLADSDSEDDDDEGANHRGGGRGGDRPTAPAACEDEETQQEEGEIPPPPSPPSQGRPTRARPRSAEPGGGGGGGGSAPARALDGPEVAIPRGGRRWWPDEERPPVTSRMRQDVHGLLNRQPRRNDFSAWQMSFPVKMPSGAPCPVSALGECGDPTCPSYRPKRPEVREAVENFVLEKCVAHFSKDKPLDTYATIGCGLLAQDWIILERLRKAGLLPRRAIFVELRTAKPVMMCEGSSFPRNAEGGGMNLRQTGFMGLLGPEFAFSAVVTFDKQSKASTIFEFCNDFDQDAIFARVGGPSEVGKVTFGTCVDGQRFEMPIDGCWAPGGSPVRFLFTCGATGVLRAYADGELVSARMAVSPTSVVRSRLFVGQSGRGGSAFNGHITKIKVWDHEVDWLSTDLMYSYEVESAVNQFAQWYSGECAVWSFGSLAAYAEAVKTDVRFAADLLMKVDVHDELDGYDDFVCQALGTNGLALTLGGPGMSWCRRGGGWCRVDASLEILDKAEAKTKLPWALLGSYPGQPKHHFLASAHMDSGHKARRAIHPPPRRRHRVGFRGVRVAGSGVAASAAAPAA